MRRQLGADDEQLALEPEDELGEARLGPVGGGADRGPCQAERRDGLIGRAVGIGPQIRLADPVAAEQQPGGPGVALARVDAHRPMLAGQRLAGPCRRRGMAEKRKRALVVNDTQEILELFEEILDGMGYDAVLMSYAPASSSASAR